MTDTRVRLEIDDGIARLTLARPAKRNALDRQFLEELGDAVGQIENAPSTRVLVLAAEGRVFCAGMDLQQMQDRASQPDAQAEWQRDTELYADLLGRLAILPMPTIAAVQGPALAGGLGLVLACDLVIATPDAFFSLPEPLRGITAAVVTPLLHYRIGTSGSSWLLLSGERVRAARARELGLCHEVVPADALAERINRLVAAVLTGAPGALAVTKRELLTVAGPDLLRQLEAARKASATARETDEAREGLQAFLERRSPNWAPTTNETDD